MPIPLLIIAMLAVVGFTGSGIGYAQTLPPFSIVAQLPPGTGLTALPGLNEAQQSMAQSINNVCPTITAIAVNPNQRDLAAVCTAMLGSALDVQGVQRPNGVTSFGIDAGALGGALESLNGGAELVVPTSQSSTLQMQQTQLLGDVVEARLSMLRNPTGSIATATAARFGQLAQAPAPWMSDAAAPSYPSRPVVLNYQTGRLDVYANGIGQFGAHDLTSRQNGYSFSNAGVILGGDYRWTPQFAAGLAFSYTAANTEFDTSALSPSGQSIRSNLFQGSLYASYSVTDALFLNGTAIIGGGDTDSRRHIVIPSTTSVPAVDRFGIGSFGVANHSINVGGGYNLSFGTLTLTPTARFQYLRTSADSFAETGAEGLNLSFGRSGHNSYLSFIGSQAQYTMPTPLGTLIPTARFEWAHQYNSANSVISVAYSNDPQLLSLFVLPADRVDHNYFNLGIGLALQLSPIHSAFIAYDTILGLSHTSYNSFVAGVRFTF